MIKIPVCFSCIHYSFENKTCPAHPEGVPGNERYRIYTQ